MPSLLVKTHMWTRSVLLLISTAPFNKVGDIGFLTIDGISNVIEREFCSKYIFEINLTLLKYGILEKLGTLIAFTYLLISLARC